uniref:Uncharacterized protein n=1 Tax=Lactuca sativa TaxID=4236 RepID=A0A9R1XCC4_LACSA|nr:hypothetical protein LSAT_V11C500239780 [Lactuca sativa]
MASPSSIDLVSAYFFIDEGRHSTTFCRRLGRVWSEMACDRCPFRTRHDAIVLFFFFCSIRCQGLTCVAPVMVTTTKGCRVRVVYHLSSWGALPCSAHLRACMTAYCSPKKHGNHHGSRHGGHYLVAARLYHKVSGWLPCPSKGMKRCMIQSMCAWVFGRSPRKSITTTIGWWLPPFSAAGHHKLGIIKELENQHLRVVAAASCHHRPPCRVAVRFASRDRFVRGARNPNGLKGALMGPMKLSGL